MSGVYRFIGVELPTPGCNLRCEYCYIGQHGDEERILSIDNDKKLFRYTVEHMLSALSVERMGGACMFNLTGSGETLLCPELVQIMYGLLENGHYVSVITNCTIRDPLEKIANFPEEYRKRIFFKCSFQYRELRKREMLDKFASNIGLLKSHGIAFGIEIVASDYLLDDIEEIKVFSLEKFGALPHVLTGRNEQIKGTAYQKEASQLTDEEYDKLWSSFGSDLFKYQQWANEIAYQDSFCYAGVYTGTLLFETGDFYHCPNMNKVTNFFEDIESPIQFAPVSRACPFAFCFCGFFLHIFSGVIREFDPGVLFYQFRDRVCQDGSTWLTPSIREVFSHRCSELHESYSPEKQEFYNALMRMVHFNEENEVMSKFISQYCRKNNYRKVAMYGMGKIGKWLLPLFAKSDVEVAYVIDRRACELQGECDFALYSPDDSLPGADAIIVSAYSEFTAIAPMLREKTDIPIVSIVDFAREL